MNETNNTQVKMSFFRKMPLASALALTVLVSMAYQAVYNSLFSGLNYWLLHLILLVSISLVTFVTTFIRLRR
jgi:hypothetical protein